MLGHHVDSGAVIRTGTVSSAPSVLRDRPGVEQIKKVVAVDLPILFATQRHRRINTRGSARWEITSKQRDRAQQ